MAYVLQPLLPNGPFRTLSKSAGDVIAAAFETGPGPLSERPKRLYLNGSEVGKCDDLAKDPRNWHILWSASVKYYAQLTPDDTMLDLE